MPMARPCSRRSVTPRTAGAFAPGAATTRFSASSSARGAGSGVRTGSSGVSLNSRTRPGMAAGARGAGDSRLHARRQQDAPGGTGIQIMCGTRRAGGTGATDGGATPGSPGMGGPGVSWPWGRRGQTTA